MNKEEQVKLLKEKRKLLLDEYCFAKSYDTYSNNETLNKISDEIVGITRMIELANLTD